jgi:hypothetical protein
MGESEVSKIIPLLGGDGERIVNVDVVLSQRPWWFNERHFLRILRQDLGILSRTLVECVDVLKLQL